jgi:hypothetical protein
MRDQGYGLSRSVSAHRKPPNPATAEQRERFAHLVRLGWDLRTLGPEADGGRGLWLVELLAAAWGFRHDGAGRSVWFQVVGSSSRIRWPMACPGFNR